MSQNFSAKSTAPAGAFQPAMDQTIPSDPESVHEHVADPAPADPDPDDPETLWDKAYARLRKENVELVEAYESLLASTASIQEGLPVRETMRAVVDNRVEVMTKHEWKIRIPWRREPMSIRDLVDKIINVVLKFKDVANVAASIDPIHVGIPVAGICVLLPVGDILLLCCFTRS
jgi:N-terminal domain of NWD NACHT-NTPase